MVANSIDDKQQAKIKKAEADDAANDKGREIPSFI
jgi:hypothetical protein